MEALLSSYKTLDPLSVTISFFNSPLYYGGQSYKNFTDRKKKPPKYKKVSSCNKIDKRYVNGVGSSINRFDIDSKYTIGHVTISDFYGFWVLRGDTSMHMVHT